MSQSALSDGSHPKYRSVADDLATRIRAGEWGHGRVPTVRDIAELYEVSSFTASRALQRFATRASS